MSWGHTENSDWLKAFSKADRELLEKGRLIASRMAANTRAAYMYWGQWEDLNDLLIEGMPLRQALEWHVPTGFGAVRAAIAESTILAILRVSDSPSTNDNTLTACLLADLLKNERVVELLSSLAWNEEGTQNQQWLVDFEKAEQPKRTAEFLELVPMGWGHTHAPPDRDDLTRARKNLKAIRDKVIAHSDAGEASPPTIDQVRDALRVSFRIAKLGSLIFLGRASGLDQNLKQIIDDPNGTWRYFSRGLVSAHREWLELKRKLDD